MDAIEFDDLTRILDLFLGIFGVVMIVERDPATEAERQIHLGDLVILGHIGVEVVLAIPNHCGRGGAAKKHAGKNSTLDRKFVQNREGSGQAKAGWACVSIRLVGEGGFASAEHFSVRFDLTMDLKPDGDDIV